MRSSGDTKSVFPASSAAQPARRRGRDAGRRPKGVVRSASGRQPEPARDRDPIEQVERPLHQQGEERRRHRALEDQAALAELNAREDRIAEPTRADQRGERGGADVDEGAFYLLERVVVPRGLRLSSRA